MSQSSSEKYLYFTVGLLKNSSALESLWQDALKHHMVDQPGQLIALRLTEYYEMMSRGIVQPVVQVPAVVVPVASEGEAGKEETAASPVAPAAQGARTPSTPLSSSPAQPQSAPSHQVSPTYPPHAPHIMSQPTK
ncbi:MAG: hypothetical protein IMW89_08430 [Ktedonobacteraceae bacterium]|nr:hypothetical protein [Ktedonobacteraceae bacterium]